MSLPDVKVGDRVWLGQYSYAHNKWRKLNLDEVIAVTATKFRVKRHPKDLYDKKHGGDHKGATYRYFKIATPTEIEAWEAEQAAKKAATEAAAREREQVESEKRERMAEVRRYITPWANADISGDSIVFTLDGYRYEIREVAAHREE